MDKIASRYAQALLDLGLETQLELQFKTELKQIEKIIIDNPTFIDLFAKTQISNAEMKEMIDGLFKSKVNLYILNLFYLLLDKHRFYLLDEICREYRHSVNKVLQIEEALVYSVYPLKDNDIKALEKELSLKHAMHVECENRLDPTLIGGIKIVFNESVIDGSLKAKLDDLKQSLHEERS